MNGSINIRTKLISCVLILLFLLLLLTLLVFLPPFANNRIARDVQRELEQTPLPEDTVLLESLSAAGKLAGNGNGVQYFGALLVRTRLLPDELEAWYSRYRKDEWSYLIDKQDGPEIRLIDTGPVAFTYDHAGWDGCYIVYTWGSHRPNLLESLDLRGH